MRNVAYIDAILCVAVSHGHVKCSQQFPRSLSGGNNPLIGDHIPAPTSPSTQEQTRDCTQLNHIKSHSVT